MMIRTGLRRIGLGLKIGHAYWKLDMENFQERAKV